MTFRVRYQGEDILTIDEQVTGVHLQTARGETSAVGLALTDGVVDLVLDVVMPGSPPRLDQIESANIQAIRDRGEEGVIVGVNPRASTAAPGLLTNQGVHDETLRAGGVRGQTDVLVHPSRDIAEGLDPNDVDARTARLEAFGDHGDIDRAIKENGPTDREKIDYSAANTSGISETEAPDGQKLNFDHVEQPEQTGQQTPQQTSSPEHENKSDHENKPPYGSLNI